MFWRNDRSLGKPMAGIGLIFFLLFMNGRMNQPFEWVLNLAIGLSYSAFLLVPKDWWTKARFIAATAMIAAETAAGLILYQETKLLYGLAIFILTAVVRMSLSRSPIPLIAIMGIVAVFYIRFGHGDLFSILSYALLTAILFLNIRSRMQRNEMVERNQRHLEELQHAYDQLQEASVTTMQHAVLEERTRIARDIHDAVGHSLTSLIVQLQALRYMIGANPKQAEQAVEDMLLVARRGLEDIRSSVHSLADDRTTPGITPLKALLSRMEDSASIRYSFHADIRDDDAGVEEYGILFRVLQEAITNVIRHSRATQVDVSLTRESGKIVMRVRDNGILQADQAIREGFGLQVMKARLAERGGSLRNVIPEAGGFEIIAELPSPAPDADDEAGRMREDAGG